MDESLIERRDYNQKLWINEYLEKLTYILDLSKDDSFVNADNYNSNDISKDNFDFAGTFIRNFTNMLFDGFFDDLFDKYKEQSLNAVVEAITVGFINISIFHGDDTIHFFSSTKQLLFVNLLQALIKRKLND